jgi:hypothetical protein
MKIILVHTPFNWKRPLTLISWAIRKVTKTYWNHCGFITKEIDGLHVFESDIKGVVNTKLKKWVKEQEICIIEITDEENLPKYDTRRWDFIKTKYRYSFEDLFWFMPVYLITNKWYGRTVDEVKNKPTCYEYCARVLGMENWFKMTPEEFISKCKKRNYKFTTPIKAKDLI